MMKTYSLFIFTTLISLNIALAQGQNCNIDCHLDDDQKNKIQIKSFTIDGKEDPFIFEAGLCVVGKMLAQAPKGTQVRAYFWKAWIDENQDGRFDNSEVLFNQRASSRRTSVKFNYPSTLKDKTNYQLLLIVSDRPIGNSGGSIQNGQKVMYSLMFNSPFTASAEDSDCPCDHYDEQDFGNGQQETCQDEGTWFSDDFRFIVDQLLVSNCADSIVAEVSIFMPDGTPLADSLHNFADPAFGQTQNGNMFASKYIFDDFITFKVPEGNYDPTDKFKIIFEAYQYITNNFGITQKCYLGGVTILVGVCQEDEMGLGNVNLFRENKLKTAKIVTYPNPTQDYVYLDFISENLDRNNKMSVTLIDESGRVLMQEISLDTDRSVIDLRSFKQGQYYLIYQEEEYSQTFRIIKSD